jgi:hypothetical protein
LLEGAAGLPERARATGHTRHVKVDVDDASSSLRSPPQPRAAASTPTRDTARMDAGSGRVRPELRTAAGVVGLQRLAGNAAVASLLVDPAALPLQRACACGGKEGDGECKCG